MPTDQNTSFEVWHCYGTVSKDSRVIVSITGSVSYLNENFVVL